MTEDALSPEEVNAILADTESEEEDVEDVEEFDTSTMMESVENGDKVNKDSAKQTDDALKENDEEVKPVKQQQQNVQLLLDIYMERPLFPPLVHPALRASPMFSKSETFLISSS